jgi:hypothetical protein
MEQIIQRMDVVEDNISTLKKQLRDVLFCFVLFCFSQTQIISYHSIPFDVLFLSLFHLSLSLCVNRKFACTIAKDRVIQVMLGIIILALLFILIWRIIRPESFTNPNNQ